MDKRVLIEQLADQLRQTAQVALAAGKGAAEAANDMASQKERGETMRTFLEQSNMARVQKKRADMAMADLNRLLGLSPDAATGRVALGSIVEIEDEESGEGKTLFLAPVGAGATLTMPGGDGYLTVITPSSPIGRAIRGRTRGEVVDVTIAGDVREWRVTFIG